MDIVRLMKFGSPGLDCHFDTNFCRCSKWGFPKTRGIKSIPFRSQLSHDLICIFANRFGSNRSQLDFSIDIQKGDRDFLSF